MSWIGTSIIIVMLVLYLMTFATEPALTIEFTGEMIKSGSKLFIKIKDLVKSFKTEDKEVIENGNK